MQDYKKLKCWVKAADVAVRVIGLTRAFPKDEQFGMTLQMRRAANSVAYNIAEGRGRGGDREFGRFLDIAYGSACELECQLIISTRAGYVAAPDLEREIDELKRMIFGFRRMLRVGGKRCPDSAVRG